MKDDDLRSSTAGYAGYGDWIFDRTKNGVSTGERRKVTPADVAESFAWLAKRQWAREQRSKPRPPPKQLSESERDKVTQELRAWLDQGPPVLERAQHSIAHKVIPSDLPVEAHIMLVQHDWAKALGEAHIEGHAESEHFYLPYEMTVFEFSFCGGVRAVIMCTEFLEGDKFVCTIFKTKSGWLKVDVSPHAGSVKLQEPTCQLNKVLKLISANIKAICIMLEAEVAEITPMREQHRSNQFRKDEPPLPAYSHHIISLARRVRLTPFDEHTPGRPKRLHFRRGHWRHYPTHRTWIRWTLVGNPDLGFVDKEYRL
jgi:hypothetical protein